MSPTQNASRLLSLVDIMELFQVSELAGLMMNLNQAQCGCKQLMDREGADARWDSKRLENLAGQLEAGYKLCEATGFYDAQMKFGATLIWLEHDPNPPVSALENEIRNVYQSLLQNSFKFQFIQIQEDRTKYLTLVTPAPLGDVVKDRFPSAHFDLCEAAECLALERHTATVFHLMRAVEWGLRALCVDVGMTDVQQFKKSGTPKLIPIEFSQWEIILNQVPGYVEKKLEAQRPIASKAEFQTLQVFYNSRLLEIEAIRDAWRNHVMHSRAVHTREDALAVFMHVARFMVALADRVSEC